MKPSVDKAVQDIEKKVEDKLPQLGVTRPAYNKNENG